MLPTTTHPDSVPFLLVRATGAEEQPELEEDMEPEVPSSRSVPPHAPPPRTPNSESELPSIMVDLRTLAAEEAELRAREEQAEEQQRQTDVDGLLATADMIASGAPTRPMDRPSSSRTRGVAIATLFAILAAGGTLAGLRAHGVSARAVGAALHLAR